MKISKRDKARKLISESKFKEAIKIVKTFDLIYSKEELRTLQIAYESLTNKDTFYKQLGINTDLEIQNAIILLDKMIINK